MHTQPAQVSDLASIQPVSTTGTTGATRLHNGLLLGINILPGVLAIDVVVVFLSVIMRYFLHRSSTGPGFGES